ncbi:MAG: choice-of-anchor J domain-containing protein [candidate division WOR-3 bacterium]|nr:choice-of-anchor J domain-containing protein [candidate division WOR-3 bacterium]
MSKKVLILIMMLGLVISINASAPTSKVEALGIDSKTSKQIIIREPIIFPNLNRVKVTIFSESFTGTTFPPTGWTRIQNNTGTQGGYPCYWSRFTTSPYYYSAPASAGLWWSYNYQDEWLITPPITLTGSPGGVYNLTWRTYGFRSSNYDDHYYTKISTDGGTTWTTLYDLSALTPPDSGWSSWDTPITISLNAYAGQTVKIAWHADDPPPPNGPGLWFSWMIDDIEIWYPAMNDVGIDQIVSPGNMHQPNTPMTPQAKVKNYGSANQTNFSVVCSIVNPGGLVRFTHSRTISLAAGRDTVISFNTWTPTVQEMLTVIMRTNLAGDENPANDRKTSTCNVSTSTQIVIGTATTYQRTEPLDRYYNYNTHEVIYLQSEIGAAGNITHIAYERELGPNTDPITPVDIYMCHTTEATLATGSITLPPTAPWELVYSGPFPNDAGTGWREVQLTTPFYYNNSENLRILIVKGFQQYISSTDCPQWRYTTTSPNYRTRGGRSDASQPTSLTQTYNRPNIRLTITSQPPPANDVGVLRIITPFGSHQANTPLIPRAVVKNYGTATQTNFPVACTIVGAGNVVRYQDTKIVTSLAAGETTVVTFATWTPTITEYESVFVRTLLAGDERPDNNRKSRGFLVHAFILMEGFNDVVFPPPGWDTIRVSGTSANNTWSRQTSGTNPTCTPIEGTAMARYYSFLAPAGNSSRLRSPAINLGTTPQPCTLKFYMTRDPGYPNSNDRITVQTSTDGINWTDIVTLPRPASAFAWEEQSVYLGDLSGTFYFAFLGISEYGNNIFIDDVRLKGRPLGTEENRHETSLITALSAPKPNPTTNGLAKISFTLAEPGDVNLTIYDASGRLVKTLVNTHLVKGIYNYTWNGTDENNRKVAEGIYFYTLKTADKKYTKKLVFTR